LALKNNCFAAAVVVMQTRPARRAGNAAVREEQRGEGQRIDSFDSTKKTPGTPRKALEETPKRHDASGRRGVLACAMCGLSRALWVWVQAKQG
jgi:hypothetical protein